MNIKYILAKAILREYETTRDARLAIKSFFYYWNNQPSPRQSIIANMKQCRTIHHCIARGDFTATTNPAGWMKEKRKQYRALGRALTTLRNIDGQFIDDQQIF